MVLIAYMIKDHPLQLHNSSCQSPRIIIFDHHHRPQAVVVVVVMMSNIKITYWSNWHCPSPLRNYHHRPHNGQPWRSTLRRPRILHISTAECWTLKKVHAITTPIYIMLLLVRISAHLSSCFTSFDNKSHPRIFIHPGCLSTHHAIVVVLRRYFFVVVPLWDLYSTLFIFPTFHQSLYLKLKIIFSPNYIFAISSLLFVFHTLKKIINEEGKSRYSHHTCTWKQVS